MRKAWQSAAILAIGLFTAAALGGPASGGQASSGGEAASFEAVLKDMIATMDKLSATLSGVKDEATAKAARPELQKNAEHFVAVRKKSETVRPPTKEEKERLEKEYRPKLFESQKKLFGEIARVRTIPGGKDALQELGELLNPPKKK
jgi:hypothetical protein